MANIGVWNSLIVLLTSRTTAYAVMPGLLILGLILLIRPQLLADHTPLEESAVRVAAAVLVVVCVLYFLFILWLTVGFGHGAQPA